MTRYRSCVVFNKQQSQPWFSSQGFVAYVLCALTFVACGQKQSSTLFERLSASETGINFVNNITESREHNVFTYQYYYNGNGVAVGDLNNDGLTDVFITG